MSENLLAGIDLTNVKPSDGYNALALGQYVVRIEGTARKAVKDTFDKETGLPNPDNGKNHYLQLVLKVYGGPSDGQTEFDNLNIWNINPNYRAMAEKQLVSVMKAIGVDQPNDKLFHGKWALLDVKLNSKNKLTKSYSALPPSMIPKDAPTVASPAPAQPIQTEATPLAQRTPSWAS